MASRKKTAEAAAASTPPSAPEPVAASSVTAEEKLNLEQAEKNASDAQTAVDARVKEVADLAARLTREKDKVFIDSKHDVVKEVSYGGVSYYVKPGANEIKPQIFGHTAAGIAQHILSALSLVELRVEKVASTSRASVPNFTGIPSAAASELAGVENPSARERAQPVLPPNDTEKYSKEALEQMRENWLRGQGVNPDDVAPKPAPEPAPKKSGAARRLAEEK